MPRRPRLECPGEVHHIMARGLDGTDIFRDDADRSLFLDLFGQGIARTGSRCYAWALLPNHYHLVVRSSDLPLWRLMKPLNSRYASAFNRRYGRRGYLFQDRYRCIPTQDQNYLAELVRYVHLNPIRAGICGDLRSLDRYRWSGHTVLMGVSEHQFQQTRDVLRRFGLDTKQARRAYRAFLEAGLEEQARMADGEGRGFATSAGADGNETRSWVIGDHDYVSAVLSSWNARRASLTLRQERGLCVSDIAQAVCAELGIEEETVRRRARASQASMGRQLVAYLGHRVYGFTTIEIGRYLGVKGPAVSMMLEKGREAAESRGMSNLTI